MSSSKPGYHVSCVCEGKNLWEWSSGTGSFPSPLRGANEVNLHSANDAQTSLPANGRKRTKTPRLVRLPGRLQKTRETVFRKCSHSDPEHSERRTANRFSKYLFTVQSGTRVCQRGTGRQWTPTPPHRNAHPHMQAYSECGHTMWTCGVGFIAEQMGPARV